MKNTKVYEKILPYVGKPVTLVINVGRTIEKEGILKVNNQHSHITVIGEEACAYIPLSEDAKFLDAIKSENGEYIYKKKSLKK